MVNGWHVLYFDAGNPATNLASILHLVSEGSKDAKKVKAPYQYGMIMPRIIKLLMMVPKIHDPKTPLQDAIDEWEMGTNPTTAPAPHKYGVFDYNTVFDKDYKNSRDTSSKRITAASVKSRRGC